MIEFLTQGAFDLGWSGALLYTLLATHITIICITVYLHRSLAHSSLTLHPVLQWFCKLWLWVTTSMIDREWAAVHRKHHAKCETADDPHSPRHKGLGTVLRFGSELYKAAARDPEVISRYAKNIPVTKVDLWLVDHRNAGIMSLLALNFVLFGVFGIAAWGLQMAWSPFFAAGIINGVGHYFGYRNHKTTDDSTNLVPWGIIIGGEELHNNHHADPTQAKLSRRWFEFDIGWAYIQTFRALGLATLRKKAPELSFTRRSITDLRLELDRKLSSAIKKQTKSLQRIRDEAAADLQAKKLELLEAAHLRLQTLLSDKSLQLKELDLQLKQLISQLQNLGLRIRLA